jgi:hypothetical protein
LTRWAGRKAEEIAHDTLTITSAVTTHRRFGDGSGFDVEGIPDVRGVHRISTAEDIEAAGFEGQVPSDNYWVGFTVGSFVYTMGLQGPPGGSVSEEQAQQIASAYYDRLTGI